VDTYILSSLAARIAATMTTTSRDPLRAAYEPEEEDAAGVTTSGYHRQRAWSIHEASPLLGTAVVAMAPPPAAKTRAAATTSPPSPRTSSKGNFVTYVIYAIVNVIIAVPGLYGYASVIFNHPVFQPHMNALAKLVIFSSMMHRKFHQPPQASHTPTSSSPSPSLP
jgi:hypothetical protein